MTDIRIQALVAELAKADEFRSIHQARAEFHHLERAHILAQPSAWYHSIVHIRMLGWALRQFDAKEFVGQVFRLVVAGPASLVGKLPVGNTGGSRVSAFEAMDPPDDLKKFFDDSVR